MTKHIAVRRDLLQGDKLLEKMKKEEKLKQVDILFGVYVVLEYRKNMIGLAGTTLKDIESFLYESSTSRNIKKVRESLDILTRHGIISYDGELDEVKPTDMIEIEITEYKSYMAVSLNDFRILKKLGTGFFLMFCFINNYHSNKHGYSFVSYEYMESLISSRTVSKHLDNAIALGIYHVESEGWKKVNDQVQRSNNMYRKSDESVAEVVHMSDSDIEGILNGEVIEDVGRYKSEPTELTKAVTEEKPKRVHGFGAYTDKAVEEVTEEEDIEEAIPIEKKEKITPIEKKKKVAPTEKEEKVIPIDRDIEVCFGNVEVEKEEVVEKPRIRRAGFGAVADRLADNPF